MTKRTFVVTLEGDGIDTIMADELESRISEEVYDIYDCYEEVKEGATVTTHEQS